MIIPLLKGLATTLRMVFTKHITLQYPEERREVSPRWRGHPELTINEDGSRRCVACTLCMVVCPSNAIKGIMADESEDHGKYPIAWFVIKTFALVFFLIWVRGTYPRFRFDQLMQLGWKVLLPLSLVNILVTGAVILYIKG